MTDTIEFLEKVVTTDDGYLLLAIRNHSTPWHEEFHKWPNDKDQIASRIELVRDAHDVYFSSHLFSESNSSKEFVLPTRTIQADLDAAKKYPIDPSVLVQTSPERFQGYWVLKFEVEPDVVERLSKRLTYAIPDSDHSGWSLGHRVRVPGTLNFKYNNGPHEVSVLTSNESEYVPEEIEMLPAIAGASLSIHDNNFADVATELTLDTGPFELVQSIRDKIPQNIYHNYMNKVVGQDRSADLWALMCSLFEAGLDRTKVFWIAKHSVNNKFAADMRFNSERELAKDVVRAEQKVKIAPVDIIGKIDAFRNMITPNVPGGALYKRRQVLSIVKFTMQHTGRFCKVVAGIPYYVPEDTGRPIALTAGSEHLRAMLHLKYGINSADPEYKHVHDGIIDEGVTIEGEIQESTLSFYSNHQLYIHTGRREVLRVTANSIERTNNAECGVLFPWHEIFEPFTMDLDPPLLDWGEIVFGDLHNTTNMQPEHARALLKSWLIFSLFRSQVSTRPILAFFGPPGAAKSTIPHRIYALLYARRLAVGGVTGAADFDTTCSKLPVYCIDNLDTYVGWIVDKLAQAIGNIDVVKRKLFTDVDMIRLRRQAMLIVTAHQPKFTREDVTQRLLLITLDQIAKERLAGETAMIDKIIRLRPMLWGNILRDVQKVLSTEEFTTSTVKWRIQDFCTMGEWIATALGFENDFNAGLRALLGSQADTIIQQEEMLSSSLIEIAKMNPPPMSAQELWDRILVQVGANQASFTRTYKNPIRLTQKLISMKSALENIIDINQQIDTATHLPKWTVRQKDE
jgi:hypothetical protein